MSFPTPWTVSVIMDRVSLVDADGRVVSEVTPSQERVRVVVPPGLPEKVIAAIRIVRSVNSMADFELPYLREEARRLIAEALVHDGDAESKRQYLAKKWPELFAPPAELELVET